MEGFEDQVTTIYMVRTGREIESILYQREMRGESYKRRRGREGVLDVEKLLFRVCVEIFPDPSL